MRIDACENNPPKAIKKIPKIIPVSYNTKDRPRIPEPIVEFAKLNVAPKKESCFVGTDCGGDDSVGSVFVCDLFFICFVTDFCGVSLIFSSSMLIILSCLSED